MAERTVIVGPSQCLEDIALQEYGSIDGVTALVANNRDVFTDGYSTDLDPGTVLKVVGDPIDVAMYNTMRQLGVTPATDAAEMAEPEELGSFNDSFNDSFPT
jgi:hypothetical protein